MSGDQTLSFQPEFRGFDHNDPSKFHMARYIGFLMRGDRWGLEPELERSDNGNSHHRVLDAYLRTLSECRRITDSRERGMDLGDQEHAADVLRHVNDYRLSGYWYPFRQLADGTRVDDFYPGTRLDDVLALYEFDARLRAAMFSVLASIELALRALLGRELGGSLMYLCGFAPRKVQDAVVGACGLSGSDLSVSLREPRRLSSRSPLPTAGSGRSPAAHRQRPWG